MGGCRSNRHSIFIGESAVLLRMSHAQDEFPADQILVPEQNVRFYNHTRSAAFNGTTLPDHLHPHLRQMRGGSNPCTPGDCGRCSATDIRTGNPSKDPDWESHRCRFVLNVPSLPLASVLLYPTYFHFWVAYLHINTSPGDYCKLIHAFNSP